MFRDRTEAGRRLAVALHRLAGRQPLILALPRGGVVVGATLARELAGELDVLLVKKLHAPGNPELALGALAEDGRHHINRDVYHSLHVDEAYLAGEREIRGRELSAQQRRYRAVRPPVPATGRVVVIVDDGLATGATMIAAVQATALAHPARLEVAVPVGPPETVEALRACPGIDAITCLEQPFWFSGVGQFYDDFAQVEDDEVVAILKQFA